MVFTKNNAKHNFQGKKVTKEPRTSRDPSACICVCVCNKRLLFCSVSFLFSLFIFDSDFVDLFKHFFNVLEHVHRRSYSFYLASLDASLSSCLRLQGVPWPQGKGELKESKPMSIKKAL